MKNKKVLLRVLVIAFIILLLIVLAGVILLKSSIQGLKPLLSNTPTSQLPSLTPGTVILDTLQITNPPTAEPTATLTPSPAEIITQPPASSGFLVYSQVDGLYDHLFAQSPSLQSSVRITNSDWDDIDPSVSTDGARIAFSSHRSGFWDIFILDLVSGSETQVTNSPAYDGHPTWSSDGQWLAYESYVSGSMDIFIRSYSDLTAAPIQLTSNSGDNFSPAWAPAPGREIAFVSNRTGDDEIWIAHLDQADNRFSNISQNPASSDFAPAFSPDGKTISWSTDHEGTAQIVVYNQADGSKRNSGFGSLSTWKKEDSNLLSVIDEPNQSIIAEYTNRKNSPLVSVIPVQSAIHGIQWISADSSKVLQNFIESHALALSIPDTPSIPVELTIQSTRLPVVPLDKVQAPYPYLVSSSVKAFQDLRGQVGHLCGWDFLSTLESAYLPLTEPPDPGIPENWLFTGRAIQVNSLPLEAGWMVLSREDFNGQTFWRVFLKTLKQDGSQGMPLLTDIWDLSKRNSGNANAYENGGALTTPPSGYWIDFTEIALSMGWQRLPALSNWRSYFQGARFDQFVNASGMDWQSAMDQLYPPEALQTYTPCPQGSIQKTP